MTGLDSVLPKRQIVERFGAELIFEEYGKNDLAAIERREPDCVHGIAASVWNRICFKNWHYVDPLQFAAYFQASNPSLHIAISTLIREEVIRDIYSATVWRKPKRKSNLVAELMIAWVYRNDLHLADVTFRDPDRPIPAVLRRFTDQHYKGLKLLPTLVDNLHRKAVELGCEQLTLTAAKSDQVALFARYGFSVEDSKSGRAALKLGFGIPMERDVQRIAGCG